MRELSMHILDIAQNSIAAGASRIEIEVIADTCADSLVIAIKDNGKGMSPELLAKVKDPFATTRTTRRVGLGLGLLDEAAKACGGGVAIQSAPGNGTAVNVIFELGHIDRAPLGDMRDTLIALIAANPEISFRYVQGVDDDKFVLDTAEIKEQLDGVPVNEPSVLKWLGEYIREQTTGEVSID